MIKRKQNIFIAASKMFAERGFRSTSMRDLSSEAGVSLSMINYHFGSKQTLLYELIHEFTEDFAKHFEEVLRYDQISHGELLNFFYSLSTFFEENEAALKIISQEDKDINRNEAIDEYYDMLNNNYSRLFDLIENSFVLPYSDQNFNRLWMLQQVNMVFDTLTQSRMVLAQDSSMNYEFVKEYVLHNIKNLKERNNNLA